MPWNLDFSRKSGILMKYLSTAKTFSVRLIFQNSCNITIEPGILEKRNTGEKSIVITQIRIERT